VKSGQYPLQQSCRRRLL